MHHGEPDLFHVHTKIFMNESVAHAPYVSPGNLGVLAPQVL